MSSNVYESRRLVLRECPGEPLVTQLAQEAGWLLIADNSAEPYAQYTHERSWQVGPDLYVHMLGDALSECCAISVTSGSHEEMESFTALLERELNPLTREELLAPIASISDPCERMRAVMRLILSASEEFDREIYDRVAETARDPDPRVRDAAVLATGYVAWPQLRVLLRQLAEHDPHPEVRRDALNCLRMYDNAGVPEP